MGSSGVRPLFSAFGVELEYIIVGAQSLDVQSIADEILGPGGEIEFGDITWSNELVSHVIELKVSEPAADLQLLPAKFHQSVCELNGRLAVHGARLMPTAMHPWMDPARETKLWPHEYSEVYATFDRIFDCRRHGWANLQSVHLNLPFADDEEFGRLHAAIRLLLPILPALAASSPVLEGRPSDFMDTRLEVYGSNSRVVPAIAGRVIPEPVFSRAAYERQILAPIYAEIAAHDPQGTLQQEWLNARGAIARFTRNTIEIRVLDVQECPQSDLAICAAVIAVLRMLVDEKWAPLADQQAVPIDPLERILRTTVRDAEQAQIEEPDYLAHFGWESRKCSAGELWRRLIETALHRGALAACWAPPLRVILDQGPLSRRILQVLTTPDAADVSPALLREVYTRLCGCLERNDLFR